MQNNCEADCDSEPAPSFCASVRDPHDGHGEQNTRMCQTDGLRAHCTLLQHTDGIGALLSPACHARRFTARCALRVAAFAVVPLTHWRFACGGGAPTCARLTQLCNANAANEFCGTHAARCHKSERSTPRQRGGDAAATAGAAQGTSRMRAPCANRPIGPVRMCPRGVRCICRQ